MEKRNTRNEILDAALTLFSVRGFEATSISEIAEAVGIRKASLYSHFASKQEILDSIIDQTLMEYNKHSIFVNADWNNPEFTKDKVGMSVDDIVKSIAGQIRYIIHDPVISKGRKMLVIEQFQNKELAILQSKQNYEDVLKYYIGMMEFLIRNDVLIEEDTTTMAAEFCLPITVWINLCDREPQREKEVISLVEKHITQFFKMYKK